MGHMEEVSLWHDATGPVPTWCPAFVVVAVERVAALAFFPVLPVGGAQPWIRPAEPGKPPEKMMLVRLPAPQPQKIFAVLAAVGPDAIARTYEEAATMARGPEGAAAAAVRTDGGGTGAVALEAFLRAALPGVSERAVAHFLAMEGGGAVQVKPS